MPTYNVIISRSFSVEIEADDSNTASKSAEFFLGYSDTSNENDRATNRFKINSIDLLENNPINIELIEKRLES